MEAGGVTMGEGIEIATMCALGNFTYEAIMGHQWGVGLEHTYFQWAAIIVAYVYLRRRPA